VRHGQRDQTGPPFTSRPVKLGRGCRRACLRIGAHGGMFLRAEVSDDFHRRPRGRHSEWVTAATSPFWSVNGLARWREADGIGKRHLRGSDRKAASCWFTLPWRMRGNQMNFVGLAHALQENFPFEAAARNSSFVSPR